MSKSKYKLFINQSIAKSLQNKYTPINAQYRMIKYEMKEISNLKEVEIIL